MEEVYWLRETSFKQTGGQRVSYKEANKEGIHLHTMPVYERVFEVTFHVLNPQARLR